MLFLVRALYIKTQDHAHEYRIIMAWTTTGVFFPIGNRSKNGIQLADWYALLIFTVIKMYYLLALPLL